MPRILGIGDNTVDVYVNEAMQYPGGNAVNVAVQARRAAAQASYLGCLGSDALGQLLYDSLVAEGVDVSHVRRIEGLNARAVVLHRDRDRKFLGSRKGVRGQYGLAEADDSFIAAHDLAHTSINSDLDAELPRLSRHARLLSYDYSEHWRRPGTAETFRHVDIAFLSMPQGTDAECHETMRWCAAGGVGLVVLTRGAQGALALAHGTVTSGGIAPATVVDTLGAGDGFIAGFLVQWLAARDVAAALQAGAGHAAAVCGYKGGYGHGVPATLTDEDHEKMRAALA